MNVVHLWLKDFRNYASAELAPPPDGLTVVRGQNGQGKTNLLEAVAWLATLKSFRGSPREALVRQGARSAVIRAEVDRDGRRIMVEAESPLVGRDRVLVNRQPLGRSRDLLGALRVTVFSPEDLELVQGGPAGRRAMLDDTLVALAPSRNDALQTNVERILRQRNTLLRQSEGRRDESVMTTLDVWDSQLAAAGSELADQREGLAGKLEPHVARAYADLATPGTAAVSLSYARSWEGTLGEALGAARGEDLRRGYTTVGPQRDELELTLGGMPARTHASQGEQRSLALALRLAAHSLVTEQAGSAPLLLLDDVFSELDPGRCAALLRLLPPGQALLTTAGGLPEGAAPALVVTAREGVLA